MKPTYVTCIEDIVSILRDIQEEQDALTEAESELDKCLKITDELEAEVEKLREEKLNSQDYEKTLEEQNKDLLRRHYEMVEDFDKMKKEYKEEVLHLENALHDVLNHSKTPVKKLPKLKKPF